jgi:hypothetical protein
MPPTTCAISFSQILGLDSQPYSACAYTASNSAASHAPCLQHLIKLLRQSNSIFQHYPRRQVEKTVCYSVTKEFLLSSVQCLCSSWQRCRMLAEVSPLYGIKGIHVCLHILTLHVDSHIWRKTNSVF